MYIYIWRRADWEFSFLHVFNTQYLHLLQVDMQGLSSSSTAVQSWRPKVTPTDCLKDVVIQLYIAGVRRFRETKQYTVARLTFIIITNIAACPYTPTVSYYMYLAESTRWQGDSNVIPELWVLTLLALEIWKWFLAFTKICVRLLCRILSVPLTCF